VVTGDSILANCFTCIVNSLRQIVKIDDTYNDVVNGYDDFPIIPALTNVDKAIAFVSFEHTFMQDAADSWKSWEILDVNTLRIHANSDDPVNTNPMDFEAIIVEFTGSSPMIVEQDVYVTDTPDDNIEVIPINPITPAESMIVLAGHDLDADDTFEGDEEFDKVRIFDANNWEWEIENDVNTGPQNIRAQIIDWNDPNVFAQRNEIDMSATTSLTLVGGTDFTAIDPTRTLLFVSYIWGPGDEIEPRDALSATLTNNGDIVFTRGSAAQGMTIAWELVEFPQDFIRVEHREINQGSGTGDSTITVNNVGPDTRAFATGTVVLPFGQGGGYAASATDRAIDRFMWTVDLESSNSVRVIRGDSTGAGTLGIQVVTFNKFRELSDSVTINDGILGITLTDSAIVSDSISYQVNITLTDSVVTSDSITANIPNVFEQIVKITGTYTTDVVFEDFPIVPPLADANKAFAFVSFRHGFSDYADTWKSYEIVDENWFRIYGTPDGAVVNTVDFVATIVEFESSSGLNIQQVSETVAAGPPAGENAFAIGTSIDPSESMIIYSGNYHDADEDTIGAEELAKVRIIDADNWGWEVRNNPNTGDTILRAQIIDWNDPNVIAQRGDSISMPDPTLTITPPVAVDPTFFTVIALSPVPEP